MESAGGREIARCKCGGAMGGSDIPAGAWRELAVRDDSPMAGRQGLFAAGMSAAAIKALGG